LSDLQVAWVGDDLTGGEHRQRLDPQIDPDHGVGPRRRGVVISTENEQNHRPPKCDTVAERIRARECSTCRASFRVDSCVRTSPMRGSLTRRRSAAGRPNAPVLNRHDMPCRFPVNRGNRTVGPRRFPVFEAFQFPNAVPRFASPDEYASFEFSAHHGATVSLARFHRFRRLKADQLGDGVNSASGMP
jgi:hypothetical protein